MPVEGSESKLTDYDAERIVVAGVMRAPDLNVRRVRFILKASDFCWVHHAWLYEKCLERWQSHRECPIRLDVIYSEIVKLIGHRINRRDFGRNVGLTLWNIYDCDPTGAWCMWKARRVSDLAERRRVIHAARVRIRDAMSVRVSNR